ncbi:MAG: sensor histidine kinase [Flavobacteriales bacterium]|nr:sensor histidine kinase [Flavobacteriales bacterium]
MAFDTPRNIALNTAMLIALASAFTSILVQYWSTGSVTWLTVIVFVVAFGVAFLIINWSIKRFIYDKVKIIYKTIHRVKSSKERRTEILDNDDPLDRVREDVLDWAEHKVEEIQVLKEKDTYRREFIGNLSHELKTPVFNIQGYVLTLLEGALEDPRINRTFLEKVEKSTERMVALLEDLDSIAKIETGKIELNLTNFNVVELVHSVVDSLEHKAKKRHIRLFVKDLGERPITVRADKMKIEQVLVNLVVNSINYGVENGETRIRFYDMEDTILVEVSDNGIGIAEEHLPRLFERFYRVDKSRDRNQGGTGLGLAIVKHIIDLHGQTINVRSTEGVGSTFSFTLKKSRS